MLDTAASHNVTRQRKRNQKERLNGVKVKGVTGTKNNVIEIEDELFGYCLYMKNSPSNLVSWSRIKKDGFQIEHKIGNDGSDFFTVSKRERCLLYFRLNENEGVYGCKIKKVMHNGKPLWIGDGDKYIDAILEGRLITKILKLSNDIYQAHAVVESKNRDFTKEEKERIDKIMRIHRSLAHCSDNTLRNMLVEGRIEGVNEKDLDNARTKYGKCQECLRGKMSNNMMKKTKLTEIRDVNVGECLHIDIMYIDKYMYMISADELTGYVHAIPIKNREKDTILEAMKRIILFYSSCGWKVKRICGDREGGFAANRNELSVMNIQLYQSSTEGHDSRIERQIRTIKGKLRSSFFSLPYKLPRDWIDHLTIFVCQSQNLVPNNKITPRTPFEIVCGNRNMNWTYNISFGDIVLARVPYVKNTGSLSERAEYGIVLGRDLLSNKVFTLYKIDTGTIVHRNQLEVVEYNHIPDYIKISLNRKAKIFDYIKENDLQEEGEKGSTEPTQTENSNARIQGLPTSSSYGSSDNDDTLNIDSSLDDNIDDNIFMDPRITINEERQSEESKSNGEGMREEKEQHEEEYREFIRKQRENEIKQQEIVNITLAKAYEQFGEDKVNQAMRKELQQLVDTETFQVCTRQKALECTLIPTNIVAAEKEDNNVKVRVVAKGDHQDRSEYKESDITSPTIRTESLLLMISIAGSKGMRLCSFDVAGAYLKAPLPEDTRIAIMFKKEASKELKNILPDMELDHLGRGYGILQKGLYGLLQAGNLWYRLLSKTMIEIGYQQCKSEPCLYYKYIDDKLFMIAVYVDDLLMAYDDCNEMERVKYQLETKFGKMKFKNDLEFKYRGLEIKQDIEGIYVNQLDCINDVVDFYLDDKDKMGSKKSAPSTGTLMTRPNIDLFTPATKPDIFRTALAKANYIATQTRPDIKLVTSMLATNTSNPSQEDERRLKHLVKYLFGSKEQGLFFGRNNKIILSAEADASWLSNPNLTGQTGGVIKVGDSVIHCISKRQRLIARSSTEAEIIAAETVATEIQWLRNLMSELGFDQKVTILYQDNQATITLLENGLPTTKTKHMQWREMRLNELIRSETIQLKYRNSSELSADLLTKPHTGERFKMLLDIMIVKCGRRNETKQARIQDSRFTMPI